MRMLSASSRCLAIFAALCATSAAQDSMQLTDGRFVTGPKMSRDEHGIVIHLKAGDVRVPSALVKETSVLDESGNSEELSEADRKKMEKGLVKFEGKWVSKKSRQKLVDKRTKTTAARIAEAMKHSKWNDRYKWESKYFQFQYTIDPDIMKWWGGVMDEYYKVFSKYWGGIKPPSGFGKLDVKFFHNNEYYDQVTGMAGTGGFFRFVPPLELDFYYDRLDNDWTLNVMFHETNHYLVWLLSPNYRYPNWLNEGLAEYYGASVWNEKTRKLEVGGLLEGRLAQVQQDIIGDTWVTFDDMMPYPNIPGNYYGWAWTFVHFMMNSDYEKNFKKLLRGFPKDKHQPRKHLDYGSWRMSYHEPKEQKEIIKKFLKIKDLDKLQKEWHAYIKTLKPASARGYYQFGRSAINDGMPIKATKMFEKSLSMGYDSPMVYVNYAKALERRPKKSHTSRIQDYKLAIEQLEKAIELDPVNALFRARYAQSLNSLARYEKKGNPEVEKQRGLASELGDCVNGGYDSYSVFLALDWDVYDPVRRTKAGGK